MAKSFERLRIYIYIYIYRIVLLLLTIFISALSIFLSDYKASANDVFLIAEVRSPALTISIPDNTVSLDLVADAASLTESDLSVFVTTTSSTGYTLMMSADTDELIGTEKIDDVYPSIPTLSADSSEAGFAANHWGYKLSNDSLYHPFVSTGVQIGYSESAANDEEEKVTFASKVNYIVPTGTYNLKLSVLGIVNPKIPQIEDYNYMQDLASLDSGGMAAVLASMTTNTHYSLSDSRDNQIYTISKLANGKVWMTRNLAIGCAGTGTSYSGNIVAKNLTSQDSNIASSYTTPLASLSIGDSYTESRIACSSTYGGYYNYTAATAGTNGENYDICPKGWRLPTEAEITSLVNAIGGDSSAASTFNPVKSGRWSGGGHGYLNNGYWWGSTTYDASRYKNWYLYTENNRLYSTNSFDRSTGLSVRCVLSQ